MLLMRKRPLIVALLSGFLILVGGGTFLGLVFNGDVSKESLDYLLSQCGVTGFVARHFGIAGLKAELAPIGLVLAMIGIGLWRLSPWARTAIIVVICVDISSAIEQLFEMHFTHSCSYVDLTSAFLGPLLLLYFLRKKIKQIFRPTLADATPAV